MQPEILNKSQLINPTVIIKAEKGNIFWKLPEGFPQQNGSILENSIVAIQISTQICINAHGEKGAARVGACATRGRQHPVSAYRAVATPASRPLRPASEQVEHTLARVPPSEWCSECLLVPVLPSPTPNIADCDMRVFVFRDACILLQFSTMRKRKVFAHSPLVCNTTEMPLPEIFGFLLTHFCYFPLYSLAHQLKHIQQLNGYFSLAISTGFQGIYILQRTS